MQLTIEPRNFLQPGELLTLFYMAVLIRLRKQALHFCSEITTTWILHHENVRVAQRWKWGSFWPSTVWQYWRIRISCNLTWLERTAFWDCKLSWSSRNARSKGCFRRRAMCNNIDRNAGSGVLTPVKHILKVWSVCMLVSLNCLLVAFQMHPVQHDIFVGPITCNLCNVVVLVHSPSCLSLA